MSAGAYNCRVSLQQLTGTFDDAGQPVETWVEVSPLWASIRHLSGMQTLKAGAEASIVKASVRIRWRAGVTAAMRIVYGAQVYKISAVMPDLASRKFVDLVCEAVQ